MNSDDTRERGTSRREFLRRAPLMAVGAMALATLGGGLLGLTRRRQSFAPDSIFRPRDGGPAQS